MLVGADASSMAKSRALELDLFSLAKTDYAFASKGYRRNRGLMDNIAKSAMSKMY